jgi:SRSO17 transposase
MDAGTILEIRPALTAYLHEFDGCFANVRSRRHLETYVAGQLSDLDRKSIEPMADAAGVPPRTLQEFLSLSRWDHDAARDRLQQRVARRHSHPHSIGLIDETSFAKKGDRTACVQRQHCGSLGKTENCVVSVHLGYVAGDFHTLLDGDVYLPEETWGQDRGRCRAAGIPDEVVYRPKWRMALEQIRRALGNGVRFAWLTFDEGYGGKPPFLRELAEMGLNFVGEVPRSFVGWTVPPEVLRRERPGDRRLGRPRKLPRLKVRHTPACPVSTLLTFSPILRSMPWERYHVRDGEKGPMVWEAKAVPFWMKDEDGLPLSPWHLLLARSVRHPEDLKFFVSDAPPDTPLAVLLKVGLSRWPIERAFEDSKGELGLDHFEVRGYGSIQRHLLLTAISHLFLAEFVEARREKKSPPDRLPGAHGHAKPGGPVVSERPLLPPAGGGHRSPIAINPSPKRGRPPQPPQTHATRVARHGHISKGDSHVSVAQEIAL